MKESKKVLLNVMKKSVEREDKFENLVINLAIRKMTGARRDARGVYYSKNGKKLLMASKTLEGEYVVAEGTEEIDDNAFWGCAFVTKIVLPESVTTIGREAFGRCISLAHLVIPKSVAKISVNPFVDLDTDTVECLSESYTIKSGLLYNAAGNKVIASLSDAAISIVPEGVTAVGDLAFNRRRSLVKVALPDGLKAIGADAFSDCDALEEVIIPASVDDIEAYAFAECDRLRSVTFLGAVKHVGATAFSDCDALRTIIVPKGYAAKLRKQLRINTESEIAFDESIEEEKGEIAAEKELPTPDEEVKNAEQKEAKHEKEKTEKSKAEKRK